MDYRKYIRDKLLKAEDRILEFGPLIHPLVSKDQYKNLFFADVKSTEDIRKLYTSNDYMKSTGITVDIDEVTDIDFVISGSYRDTFKKENKFDVIYLSHVVEHMPDIINFFQDIRTIISSEGMLILIYPDARYCFDHFRNGTSFIDAYDTYINKKPCSNGIFDFVNNVVHENRPDYFWNDLKQNNLLPTNDFEKSIKAYKKSLCNEMPDDVHLWPFADYQFVKFLYDMDRAGLLDFDIKEFHETQNGAQEFMVVLSPKNRKIIDARKYQRILGNISPQVKEIISDLKINNLQNELLRLRDENLKINTELSVIYASRRWRYTSIAADMSKIIKGR